MSFEEYILNRKFGDSGIMVIEIRLENYWVKTDMSNPNWFTKRHFIDTIISIGDKEIQEIYPEEFI